MPALPPLGQDIDRCIRRMTRKAANPKTLTPVCEPPLRTAYVDYLGPGPQITPKDPSSDHPQNKIKIINNYSPKWRWIVMDIYWAAKWRSKYPSLSPTLRWIIVLVYTTQAEKLLDQNVTLCVTRGRKSWKSLPPVAQRWIVLANHLRVYRSERAKSTIHWCCIY